MREVGLKAELAWISKNPHAIKSFSLTVALSILILTTPGNAENLIWTDG